MRTADETLNAAKHHDRDRFAYRQIAVAEHTRGTFFEHLKAEREATTPESAASPKND